MVDPDELPHESHTDDEAVLRECAHRHFQNGAEGNASPAPYTPVSVGHFTTEVGVSTDARTEIRRVIMREFSHYEQ